MVEEQVRETLTCKGPAENLENPELVASCRQFALVAVHFCSAAILPVSKHHDLWTSKYSSLRKAHSFNGKTETRFLCGMHNRSPEIQPKLPRTVNPLSTYQPWRGYITFLAR